MSDVSDDFHEHCISDIFKPICFNENIRIAIKISEIRS